MTGPGPKRTRIHGTRSIGDFVKLKAKSEAVMLILLLWLHKKLVKGLHPGPRRTSLKVFGKFLDVPSCTESCQTSGGLMFR